jgi:hypothetical protein
MFMPKVLFILLLTIVAFCQSSVFAQSTITKLRDVKTIYVDEKSFNFKSSSCMKIYGNQKVVCTKHLDNRKEFLATLKVWVEKYKFTLVSKKDDADAILQGDLSIDDNFTTREHDERTRNREKGKKDNNDSPSLFNPDYLPGEPLWNVDSWLVNQNGDKLWTKGGWFPAPSYGWSSPAKIQAKKLAREIQYDFEKSK